MKASRLVLPGLAALGATLTGHPLCDLIFRCGCTWMFAGSTAHCDVHTPGPPDCPVCTSVVFGVAFAAALFAAWLGGLKLLRMALRG